MPEFLYICEYLGISPKDFFDEEQEEPRLQRELAEIAEHLEAEDLQALIGVARRLGDLGRA